MKKAILVTLRHSTKNGIAPIQEFDTEAEDHWVKRHSRCAILTVALNAARCATLWFEGKGRKYFIEIKMSACFVLASFLLKDHCH